MKKLLSIFLCLLMLPILGGCSNSNKFSIHELPEYGGYICTAGAITCKVVTTAKGEYIEYSSKSRDLQCYISNNEMIVLNTVDGQTTYSQDVSSTEQDFSHPLAEKWAELSKLDFTYKDTQDGFEVYRAISTKETTYKPTVNYTVYHIQTQWTDGTTYQFEYHVYDNGEDWITSTAPTEIATEKNVEKPWKINLDECAIYNSDTKQSVPMEIQSTESSKGFPPSGGESVTEDVDTEILAFFDPTSGKIMRIQYASEVDINNAVIELLYDESISKPEITGDMTPMSSLETQYMAMLIFTLDSMAYLNN